MIKPMHMKKNIFCLFTITLFLFGCANPDSAKGSPKQVSKRKPTVNFYLENSGSMFGYITTGNDFDRSLSSLLTQMKVSGYTDNLNLFYINSEIFKQNVDIPTFIKDMAHPTKFKGKLESSDMCHLFNTITDNVDNNSVSIMVSDCIFSPGKVDAKKFIGAEKDCITLKLHEQMKNRDLAFVVYRMMSNFNGVYYDCKDSKTTINNERPYFIWIIGTKENIAEFNRKGIKDKIEGNLENTYTMFKSKDEVPYAVQTGSSIGSFERKNPITIIKAKPDNSSGKLTFSVAVDFSSLLVDDAYLTNPKNYTIKNPNYSIEIKKKKNQNYTHEIKITTSSKYITATDLSIRLNNVIPNWIEQYSDDTCTHINSEGMMEKTYGLKQLVDGIYSAFNFKNDVLSEINININL